MGSVLLATFNLLPDGEEGGDTLVEALAARGHDARWAVWDDGDVRWSEADVVAVRSTWDYHRRYRDFLAWARATHRDTPILNGPVVFSWNADKSYLVELDDQVPVVPTALLEDSDLVDGLGTALERWGTVVVKPRIGAGGVGLVVADTLSDPRLEGLTAGPWVVQPLVPSVRTVGEVSVFVFDGRATAQVEKTAASNDVRVHELYGGSTAPVPLTTETAELAERAVARGAEHLSEVLHYARVDMLRWQDAWVVSELELIEPGLGLDVLPSNAAHFADLLDKVLG
jgi:glutathione synthase/RimK-type ligase-like ATP-grasp enzyme